MAEYETDHQQSSSSFSISDISYAVFKHKWKILLCTVIGLTGAAAVYFLYPAIYESNAKLLVRYILERSPVDPVEAGASDSGRMGENVIGSELEILTSWDLAVQVAEAVGVNRLLPDSKGATITDAAAAVSSGIKVDARKGSNIIFVSYMNRRPELTALVLDELVNRYFNKHLEVHRSAGAFDFVTQQTDQVRTRLNQTEDALKALKGKAGIISLPDSMASISAEQRKVQDELQTAEQQLAEQRERVKGAEASGQGHDGKAQSASREASNSEVQEYQALITRLAQLHQRELDLLSKYTASSSFVKNTRSQMAGLENRRRDLAKKFPDLPTRFSDNGASQNQGANGSSAGPSLKELEARVEALKSHLSNIQSSVRQLSDTGAQITDLERNRELEEANYKYFKGTLEKARVDEALDPSKMPNISAVQRPSPPVRLTKTRDKIALTLAGGGLALGLIAALFKELLVNRTLKRPHELEKRVVAPLLSISYQKLLRGTGQTPKDPTRALMAGSHKKDGGAAIAPWEEGHFIRPYSEAIRDRLSLFFEINQMTHKPKLVGVTSASKGAGTSTIAAGLAAALSEMGDGKVLLVDVNIGHAEVHPFFKGRPAAPLSNALTQNGSATSASENLYLATLTPPGAGPVQLALKRFFALVPNLKASDFDYIIFDMPPLTDISSTFGMARFMDKLLLVVEAEKSNRDAVKKGYDDLVRNRAKVSIVMNKVRSYAPKWLEGSS